MKQFLPILARNPLMENMSEEQISSLLSCLKPQLLSCQKGNIIFHQDDPARFFGVVLSGSVQVMRGDTQGSHIMIAELFPGEMFGETFACAGINALPVNAIARSECVVLLFEHERVLSACAHPCKAHSRLILNLLRSTAQKNLFLSRKLEIVMQRTTRDKLMAYLRFQAQQANADQFTIPFDRQELADFLGAERSAMSTELNKLKKAGVIHFEKNEFQLLLP